MTRGPRKAWADRRRGPNRLTVLLFLLTCLYVTVVFAFAESINRQQGRDEYANARQGCSSRQSIVMESNRRAPMHERDARNLSRLTAALARNRKKEAMAFESLGRKFRISPPLHPLVRTLRRASELDASIRDAENSVRFRLLPVPDCREIKKP